MLEIFAFPYFLVSGVIGWVIFKPFFRANEIESLSCAKITIADLLAISLPAGVLFAVSSLITPPQIRSPLVQMTIVALTMLFAVSSLWVSLLLVTRMCSDSFIKRMTLVGMICPFGIIFAFGWVGLLIWSGSHSISYLAPVSVAMAAGIFALRHLSVWVCQDPTLKGHARSDRPRSTAGTKETIDDAES